MKEVAETARGTEVSIVDDFGFWKFHAQTG